MSMNSSDGKSNKLLIAAILLIIMAAAMAGGFFYAYQNSKPTDILNGKKTIDLLDQSKDAHRNVDNILLLKKDHWQLQEKSRDELKEKVPETGGRVIWVKRQLSIGVPVTTDLHGAADWLKDRLSNTELKVVSERTATYNTYDSYRIDVGVEVKAGDSYKRFITDTIYFFHNGNLYKEDKDVIKYPEKPVHKDKEQYKGKMAVIVDECGASLAPVRNLLDTGLPFSYAILPFKDASKEVLQLVKDKGRTALLDLPLEPNDPSDITEDRKTILTSMSEPQVQTMVNSALAALPGVEGVINYQGSKATADQRTMTSVLGVVKEKNLFFIDGATSARSLVLQESGKLEIPAGKSSLYLGNRDSLDSFYEDLVEAAGLADRYGYVIVICHGGPLAARAWTLYGKELQESGITFVPVTDLIN